MSLYHRLNTILESFGYNEENPLKSQEFNNLMLRTQKELPSTYERISQEVKNVPKDKLNKFFDSKPFFASTLPTAIPWKIGEYYLRKGQRYSGTFATAVVAGIEALTFVKGVPMMFDDEMKVMQVQYALFMWTNLSLIGMGLRWGYKKNKARKEGTTMLATDGEAYDSLLKRTEFDILKAITEYFNTEE